MSVFFITFFSFQQRECEQRYQETLSCIRRKAVEMSTPQHESCASTTTPRDGHHRGWCRLCRIEVDSMAHFNSRRHRSALLASLPMCLRRADRWDIERLNTACFVELPPKSTEEGEEKEETQRLRRLRKSADIERQRLLDKRLNAVRQKMTSRLFSLIITHFF